MNWVKFNSVAFNADWVKTKTLKEFSEHEKHHGFTPEQYKEAYELCKNGEKKADKPAAEKPAEN